MNEDDLTSSIRDKILTITVKKGWKEGTRITFPQEGDQGPNNIPGSLLSLFALKWSSNNECNTAIFLCTVMTG